MVFLKVAYFIFIIFSVMWIFYMGVKFLVFKFRKDFYSRVFNFRDLFTIEK